MRNRNEHFSDEPGKQVPNSLLKLDSPELLSKWLKLFFAEARKQDGSRYPSKTLYLLLSGLLRYMRLNNPNYLNLLDTKNGKFASLNNAMDNVFRDLCMSGVDSDSKESEVLSKDEEKQRWEGGVLECNSPKALFRAVFFINGKNFCLRGGDEHRSLKFSQLKRHHEPNRYVYGKCFKEPKWWVGTNTCNQRDCSHIYASPESGTQCHVYILDKYISKLPQDAQHASSESWITFL